MSKGQNGWLLSHHRYELTEFDGIEVYQFCILELLKSCHEIETRMESFLELCGKVVKMWLGSFMELQFRNVLRLIKVWNFLFYELLDTNLIFYTFSMTWFIFYNKSIIFRLRNWFEVSLYQGVCRIQEIYSNAIWSIRYQDNSFARSWKVQRDVKLKFSEAVLLSYERFEDLRRYEIFKV